MPVVNYNSGELPNLVDVTKRLDPDGSIPDIAELLEQSNPIIADIPLVEGNLPTGHRTTVRTDTPVPTWRRLNYGVRPTKSHTAQVDDTIGQMEAYSEIDKKLAMLNGNTAAYRLSEDIPHLEGMAQDLATTLFYGDTATNPEKFLGLAPRYGTLTLSGKPAAQTQGAQLPNVVDNGGTGGTLTSIWYIAWGNSVHGIYPKGSMAGLSAEDLGEVTLIDNDGGRFQGYRSHYTQDMGLTVRDWRCISRLANIDVSALDNTTAQITLYKNMIKMMHAIPPSHRGKGVFYCSPTISAMLDLAAVAKDNASLGYSEIFGNEILAFRKRPLRECDSILETEVQVV